MSEYRLIPLSGKCGEGKFAKVSLEDYARVASHRWHFKNRGDGYADRNLSRVGQKKNGSKVGKYATQMMHRFILEAPEDTFVDHINGDTLDNRRENLRLCSPQSNTYNRRPNQGQRFKGVHKLKSGTGYQAYISFQRKRMHLGTFATAEDAARAYNRAAIELFGDFAHLNEGV